MGRRRIKPFSGKTGITRKDFLAHLESRDFGEYVQTIYPILTLQSVYEEVYSRTDAGEKKFDEEIFVEELGGVKTISEVFEIIQGKIDQHNNKYYNSENNRGVFIDTIKTRDCSKKSLASFIGRERNVCLVPFIIGIEKNEIEDFIMETMEYKNRFRRFVINPFHPRNDLSDPKQRFRTFCDRVDRKRFFYVDYSFKRDLAVVLPDFEERLFTRQIDRDVLKIINSPEIQLLSIMSYYLSNSQPEIDLDLDYERDKIKTERSIKDKDVRRIDINQVNNFQTRPKEFPQGEPFEARHVMGILNKFNLEELNQIFDKALEKEEDSFRNNPYALCRVASATFRKSERPLPKNPDYFQIGYDKINWKEMIRKRVDEIKRNGGFKLEKMMVLQEECEE